MSSKSPATGRGKGGGAGKGVDSGGKPTSSVQRVKGPLALSDKSPLFRDCSNDPRKYKPLNLFSSGRNP